MLNRIVGRALDVSGVEVTFLTKDGCRLCDEALSVVEGVRRRFPFKLDVVHIVEGDEWYERFGDKIPVGLIDGRMIFKYRVNPLDFFMKLRASRHH
ncbi:MAG TPA: glutaredoxin family protein [Candidatus Kapabacteria bacterium]|jgi:hypothetical protein|nr:glutaredoxin family protein [Candidatus Kapabacteria bacterium]